MIKRGPKRNPNSGHQLIMNTLFGKKEAANQPSCWRKWPKPQRDIYSRMFANHLTFTDTRIVKAQRELIKTVTNFPIEY